MAKTPVKLEVDGYKEREVMMVKYEFDQATDVEGQMSGIPRGGKINIRVKRLTMVPPIYWPGWLNAICQKMV